jgi:Prealbumin-like fold domain
VQSATTAASCGTYNNTATFTSTNAGSGSDDASVTVQCGALRILKNSTKGGAVDIAGAVFSVDGPDANTDPDFSVTDDTTAAAPDEDADVGEVCVSGLAPGSYAVNETTPPTGYGGASQTNLPVTVVTGTNCTTSPPGAGATATFTNAPLADIQVRFRDGGSGEAVLDAAGIDCNNATGTSSTADTTGWDDTLTVEDIQVTAATITITCTIAIDP